MDRERHEVDQKQMDRNMNEKRRFKGEQEAKLRSKILHQVNEREPFE